MTILDQLPALVAAMRRNAVRSLTVGDAGTRLTLRLAEAATQTPVVPAAAGAPAVTRALSPEMGIFRLGAEGAQTGATVACGAILGFVEIGPALLPIPSPAAGTLSAVLAEDGAPIGFHAPAFEITDA
ncbi:conserved hypothetical protein [Gluconacetobacter diazotrophicus PA1 5]|uniref:Uncharacterized protein n=2 Tax=Gluconacetobacter diazotrophicus TaxID=33996 RepID=A9H2E7_GLUDA|nr:hypothetical protein [Gluconacetobacter diazotrophicus]ACI52024.1 conserved hypothetical protein [Gluconacetobacter diazotrophicus PA1 5]MBB2157465.1 hypothetical protein [Gluconacetobacter diazotrophicus]TWB05217.1 hypothetical protein FBZ86_11747 [Gluconacetobacter diazotrophicus]CAP54143.1 conserved hypothetical protein [Gluconacetobacter diazotrophicus PA1 5]